MVDAGTGASIASVRPQGTPLAIALSPHVLATLELTHRGLRLAWYARDEQLRTAIGSVAGPADDSPEAERKRPDSRVFTSARSISARPTIRHRSGRSLVTRRRPPIGLSLEGSRLAWAENGKHGADASARCYVNGRG